MECKDQTFNQKKCTCVYVSYASNSIRRPYGGDSIGGGDEKFQTRLIYDLEILFCSVILFLVVFVLFLLSLNGSIISLISFSSLSLSIRYRNLHQPR